MGLKQYQRKSDAVVTAIQLDLSNKENGEHGNVLMKYYKWGGLQEAKSGDWLVCNGGDVYTVDQTSFSETYIKVSSGQYRKHTKVWAEKALKSGKIKTKEGYSSYKKNDFLVYNKKDRMDGYTIPEDIFNAMYIEVKN